MMSVQDWYHGFLSMVHITQIMTSVWLSCEFLVIKAAERPVTEFCQFESFTAKCKQDQVIVMTRAQYGRMRLGRCVRKDLGYVGCYTDAMAELDFLCSGRQKCDVRVPDLGTVLELRMACLEELKNYLEAAFICVDVVVPKQTSCQSSTPLVIGQTSGYLASTTTFKTSCGSHSAPWLIQVEPGQKLNITLHDFTRGYHTVGDKGGTHHSTTCYAYAVAKEQGHKDAETVCGGGARMRHVLTSTSNRLEVRILQGSNNRRSYFLLQFQTLGCSDPALGKEYSVHRLRDQARVTCSATGETWTVLCDSNQWTGNVGNCSSAGHGDEDYGFRLVMGSISMSTEVSIVVVLAVACVIGMCILLSGLCYIRRRAYLRHSNTPRDYAPTAHYDTQGQVQVADGSYKIPDNYHRPGNIFAGNEYACIMDAQCMERISMETNCTCDVNTGTGYGTRSITWPQRQSRACAELRSSRDDLDSLSSCGSDEPMNYPLDTDKLEKSYFELKSNIDRARAVQL